MLNYQKIPVHYMLSGMQRYVEHGIEPGSFLTAVLCNDLKGAVANADDNNIQELVEWVRFCWNELPANIWGSPEKVAAHIEACATKRAEQARGERDVESS